MRWQEHLDRAFIAGVSLHESLVLEGEAPEGIVLTRLEENLTELTSLRSKFESIGLKPSAYITTLVLGSDVGQLVGRGKLVLHIVSDDLKYPLSQLSGNHSKTAGLGLGEVSKLMASFCSEPVLFAGVNGKDWYHIDGQRYWHCSSAPSDQRLFAAIVLVLAVLTFISVISGHVAQFSQFAQSLRERAQMDRPIPFSEDGPDELKETVQSLNAYLESERDRLEKRAQVLSGVSHDLGTPATRLKLRAALIEDKTLRDKLTADIDQMTTMIDSALTYTRSEIDKENFRSISLTALVDAIVSDYQDVGQNVSLIQSELHSRIPNRSSSGRSIKTQLGGQQHIIVNAKSLALTRAITNLIDNAVKFGRKAKVSLDTNSTLARIIVEDEGHAISEEELLALVTPFKRGENSETVEGTGLGLAIASTIARQHGGKLDFHRTADGLKAILEISREQ